MRTTVIVACLCLIAAMGCERKPQAAPGIGSEVAKNPKPIDPAMAPKLQALATSACHCEQKAKTKAEEAACWTNYYQVGKASIEGEYATACAPISAGGHVYNGETPQEFRIYTGSHSAAGKLCTEHEVIAVETAWQAAFDAGLSGEAMRTRMRQALQDFQDGREVAMTGGGCGRPSRLPPPPVAAG